MQRKYAVIGKGIQYSKSKYLFEIYNKFISEELSYDIVDTDSISKELLLKYDGVNITTPYKVEVIQYLDSLEGIAVQIGAVNCVKNDNGKLIGYNTDYYGFDFLFSRGANNFLLLGNGGVCKMIRIYCKRNNINLTICGRDTSTEYHDITYSDLNDYSKYDYIINATKFGILPPIDYTKIDKETHIVDLSYVDGNDDTVFIKEFLKNGHNPDKVKDGFDMLVRQALESYKIWGLWNI